LHRLALGDRANPRIIGFMHTSPGAPSRVDESARSDAAQSGANSGEAIEILRRHEAAIYSYFQEILADLVHQDAPPKLVEAIAYTIMAAGKRLRPALILECFDASRPASEASHADSADPHLAEARRAALAAGGAMELIHNFSLVHDDLPAMDDDDLRRGRPTNHKVYGEAMAILAGDAMVSLAFERLVVDAPPKLATAMVRELAVATGPIGMIGGQVLDIDPGYAPTTLPQLQRLHRMKTGALLTASCRLGAIAAAADANTLEAMNSYGRHLGLAFQIVDDMLDVTATAKQLGKATNKDQAKGKITYPMLIGLTESGQQAQEHLKSALDAIAPLGGRASGLRALAHFVVERQH
jgi:geranylgeranyl diphosphate synthase, type II